MPNSLSVQVGGTHYKKYKYQPIEFIVDRGYRFIEGNIFKYLCRWRDKNGVADLKKALHYTQLSIDLKQGFNQNLNAFARISDFIKINKITSEDDVPLYMLDLAVAGAFGARGMQFFALYLTKLINDNDGECHEQTQP